MSDQELISWFLWDIVRSMSFGADFETSFAHAFTKLWNLPVEGTSTQLYRIREMTLTMMDAWTAQTGATPYQYQLTGKVNETRQ